MGIVAGLLDPLTQTFFDNSQAGVNNTQNPVVIVGQVLAANPQPFALYGCSSVGQARAFAGRGSMLARTFEAYFANDQIGPIYLLPYADPAGSSAAAGTITLTGPASANGTLALYVCGFSVPVGVTSGDTATVMAANLAAAVNAALDTAVTAAAAAGVVTLTAKNKGALGNLIDVRFNYYGLTNGEIIPAGVTLAVVAMSGGAGTPDTTQIAPLLGDTAARLIVHPYAGNAPMANFAAMMNASTGRWAPLRQSMGHCFTAHSDTVSTLETYGPTNNDPHSSVFAYEMGSPTSEWEAAGMWAGAMASSLRGQPNQPVQTLQLIGFLPPPAGLAEASGGAFSRTTRNTLLGLGLGVARYDGGQPAISRAPTTYQLNGYGQPDQSYFDTETMFTLMRIQDSIITTQTQKFGRYLIADDGTKAAPGVPLITPSQFKAWMVDLYNQWEYEGLVEDAGPFIAASSVTRNLTNPSELDVLWAPFLVVGLRDIANTVQFRMYSAAAAAAATGAAQ